MRILHVHSTFNAGGPQVRAAQLMNALGPGHAHLLVSSLPDQRGALDLLDRHVRWSWLEDFPDLKSGGLPARLHRIGAALRAARPDLVLTYNWGAMDAVMANRLFARLPLVHHEDGFGPDELAMPLPRRSLYRWAALGGAQRVIACSRNLERIARQYWRQPGSRLVHIPNGVDIRAFTVPPDASAIPGRDPALLSVGTVAGLRPEKNVNRLVRIFAAAARDLPAQLVIVGDGPDREAIQAEARALGIAGQLVMPGFLADPARYVGLMDVFALTSDTEQFPLSLVEAMAAGCPVVASDVGDVARMLAPENLPFIAAPAQEAALCASLRMLLTDGTLRHALGRANAACAAADFGHERMIARYRAVYAQVAGQAV